MHFFVPDVPAVYTLEAQGYPREKAEWEARRQGQYLKNKIRRALESLSLDQDEASEMILDWEKLSSNPRYMALYEQMNQRFESDLAFRAECLDASRWVLSQKTSDTSELTEEALLIAVKYFLAELPLFADTAHIVASPSSVFCYHQRVDFLERFYKRQLTYKPSTNQAFMIVSPEDNFADDILVTSPVTSLTFGYTQQIARGDSSDMGSPHPPPS